MFWRRVSRVWVGFVLGRFFSIGMLIGVGRVVEMFWEGFRVRKGEGLG